jgi:hypothetical protein
MTQLGHLPPSIDAVRKVYSITSPARRAAAAETPHRAAWQS